MSASEAIREAPRRRGEATGQARPQLRRVPSPQRRVATAPFAVMMVLLLVGGMVGLLALITSVQNQAFEVRETQRTANELGYKVSDLEARTTRAKAPAELARRATALGMVPNPHGVFIDLGTGRVVGEAKPVTGNEIPSLKVVPPAAAVPPLDGTSPAVDPSHPDAGTAAAPADPAAGTPMAPGQPAATTSPAPEASPSAKPSATPAAKPSASPSATPSGTAAAKPSASTSARPAAKPSATPKPSTSPGARR